VLFVQTRPSSQASPISRGLRGTPLATTEHFTFFDNLILVKFPSGGLVLGLNPFFKLTDQTTSKNDGRFKSGQKRFALPD